MTCSLFTATQSTIARITNPLNPFEVASQNTGLASRRAAAELFVRKWHIAQSKTGLSQQHSGWSI